MVIIVVVACWGAVRVAPPLRSLRLSVPPIDVPTPRSNPSINAENQDGGTRKGYHLVSSTDGNMVLIFKDSSSGVLQLVINIK